MARALLILAITLLVALSGNARAGQEKPSAESPNATTQDDDIRAVFNLLLAGQHEQAIKAVDEFFTRYPLGSETFSVGLAKAESQYRLQRIDDAIKSYEQALPFIEKLNNVAQRRFARLFPTRHTVPSEGAVRHGHPLRRGRPHPPASEHLLPDPPWRVAA